jgi:hypothetical protein
MLVDGNLVVSAALVLNEGSVTTSTGTTFNVPGRG